jgi:hypothetical protein
VRSPRFVLIISAAAAVFLNTAGCQKRATDAASQASQAASPAPETASATVTPTPVVYTPPYPAQKRGGEAFKPVIRMSDNFKFETHSLARRKETSNSIFTSTVEYPRLVGGKSRAIERFNKKAHALAVEEVDAVDVQSDPDVEEMRKTTRGVTKDIDEFHDLSYTVVFATDDLISVLFYVVGYNWPAAHSYHYPLTINFDMKRGRELTLAELFNPGSNYLQRIAQVCDEDLKRQFDNKIIFAEGTKPTQKNYKAWAITPDGIVVIFEEYQLVAYAQGEPKVLIPFESLRDIIRPRGPLASLAASE